MYACIRWTDMKPGADVEDERDPRVITHHPDYDEIREVVGHKEHPPDGYYEQYKLKLEQYYLEDIPDREGGDDSENYRGFGGVNLRGTEKKDLYRVMKKIGLKSIFELKIGSKINFSAQNWSKNRFLSTRMNIQDIQKDIF
jgi:hypothetical protein